MIQQTLKHQAHRQFKPTLFAVSVMILTLLSACDTNDNQKQMLLNQAMSATPADPQLAEIYQRSCKSCHAVSGTSAPLSKDKKAWASRMDKGIDQLVDNVVQGYGGMPPFGMCMDCDIEEFKALILFMADHQTSDQKNKGDS